MRRCGGVGTQGTLITEHRSRGRDVDSCRAGSQSEAAVSSCCRTLCVSAGETGSPAELLQPLKSHLCPFERVSVWVRVSLGRAST